MSQEKLFIDLETFQGPFDLLLHLIKTMEIDINDIPIAEITNQYLIYVQSMSLLELDMIGDYLVMAATLIEIKSRLLLPIEPHDDYDEDYDDQDPRQALVQQLLMYQQFQAVSNELQIIEEERSKLFLRPITDLSDYQENIPLEPGELSVDMLSLAMLESLEKYENRKIQNKEITQDYITVEEMIDNINEKLSHLSSDQSINFEDLVPKKTRPYIITTFMAMLELVRKKSIIFKQDHLFDPISIMNYKL